MHSNGSEWHRWDLHIHTPETALNDQFADWEGYPGLFNALYMNLYLAR